MTLELVNFLVENPNLVLLGYTLVVLQLLLALLLLAATSLCYSIAY